MLTKAYFEIAGRLSALFQKNRSTTILSQPSFDVWGLELDSLAAEILSLSGLRRERLDDAAVELSIGVELHGEECPRHQDATNDPYDEILAFATSPGLDYTEVDGSE